MLSVATSGLSVATFIMLVCRLFADLMEWTLSLSFINPRRQAVHGTTGSNAHAHFDRRCTCRHCRSGMSMGMSTFYYTLLGP